MPVTVGHRELSQADVCEQHLPASAGLIQVRAGPGPVAGQEGQARHRVRPG